MAICPKDDKQRKTDSTALVVLLLVLLYSHCPDLGAIPSERARCQKTRILRIKKRTLTLLSRGYCVPWLASVALSFHGPIWLESLILRNAVGCG